MFVCKNLLYRWYPFTFLDMLKFKLHRAILCSVTTTSSPVRYTYLKYTSKCVELHSDAICL